MKVDWDIRVIDIGLCVLAMLMAAEIAVVVLAAMGVWR